MNSTSLSQSSQTVNQNLSTCFEHCHMTPAEYGLWCYAWRVSHQSKRFYFNGEKMSKTAFTGLGKHGLYRLRDSLIRKGWLQVLAEPKRTQLGIFSCGIYYPLSHEEWSVEHSGECHAAKEVENDVPTAGTPLDESPCSVGNADSSEWNADSSAARLDGSERNADSSVARLNVDSNVDLKIEKKMEEKEEQTAPSSLSKDRDLKAAAPASPEPQRQRVESENPVNGRTVADEYADFLLKLGDEFPRPTFRPSDAKAWKKHVSTRLGLLRPLLKHIRDGGVVLTEKQQQKLRDTLFATFCSRGCLLQAVDNILEPLDVTDSFEHAGSKLVAGLLTECQAVDRDGQTSNGPHIADELFKISTDGIPFNRSQRKELERLDRKYGRQMMKDAYMTFINSYELDAVSGKRAAEIFIGAADNYVYSAKQRQEETAKRKVFEARVEREAKVYRHFMDIAHRLDALMGQVQYAHLMKELGGSESEESDKIASELRPRLKENFELIPMVTAQGRDRLLEELQTIIDNEQLLPEHFPDVADTFMEGVHEYRNMLQPAPTAESVAA